MGKVPLRSIKVYGDDTIYFDDILKPLGVYNQERLHSPRIDIEYYPERKYALITIMEPKDARPSSKSIEQNDDGGKV